jgi:hypothetical protein
MNANTQEKARTAVGGTTNRPKDEKGTCENPSGYIVPQITDDCNTYPFPPNLDDVAWIEISGYRFYNSNFAHDLSECVIHNIADLFAERPRCAV